MRKTLALLAIALSVFVLPAAPAAAKDKIVTYAEKEGKDVPTAGPDESEIVFIRGVVLGGVVAATIYERHDDGSLTFITAVYPKTYAVHKVAPGKHIFAVASEAADFIEVNVSAGKTYPIVVTPRMGVWKARFSLLSAAPGTEFWEKVPTWLEKSTRVSPSAAGPEWFDKNKMSVLEKAGEYWPKWIAREDRPIVKPEDGVDGL